MKKIVICLLLISFICVLLIGCSNKKFSELSKDDQEAYLWSMAEETVKDNLKTPSTAKFPAYSNFKVKSEGDNIFTISSYVDAQNSFGAMIRSDFVVKIKVKEIYDNGYKYTVQDIRIQSK